MASFTIKLFLAAGVCGMGGPPSSDLMRCFFCYSSESGSVDFFPLIFITLPKVFAQMPGGRFIAVLFFLSVIFAGITSLINMFEVCAEAVTTHLKLPRKAAVVLVGALAFAAGAFIEFEPYLGKWMDAITIYVVPFGALLCAFIIYWVLGGKRIGEELVLGRKKALCRAFLPTARYLYVGLAVLVFILSIICGGIG